MSDFNTRVITEFRANHGRVDTAGFGRSLVLLHTTGARTGAARVNPVLARRDGDEYALAWRGFVAQSAAFASYQRRAGDRHIPVIRLRRRDPAVPAAT